MFLESAFFYPDAIAGRGGANFASDASHRFERGVDFNNNVDGIERATRLILEICGGEPDDRRHRGAAAEAQARAMRVARAENDRRAGAGEGNGGAFKRLGFSFKAKSASFVVSPPSYRFDIAIEEDLIEEVARLYGFERIAAHPQKSRRPCCAWTSGKNSPPLRERLAAADYREVINFSFVEPRWKPISPARRTRSASSIPSSASNR